MDFFQWDESLNTGFAEVDHQHQYLVKLTNDFGALLAENQLRSQDVETLYAELVDYTQYHFQEEETLAREHDVDAQGALQIAQLVHERIRALRVTVPGGEWLGSISVGVAVRSPGMEQPQDLIKLADRGVYAAKEAGRNCLKMLED